jgi:hypothetical protein
MNIVVNRLSTHASSVVYGPRVYTNGESATVTTCIAHAVNGFASYRHMRGQCDALRWLGRATRPHNVRLVHIKMIVISSYLSCMTLVSSYTYRRANIYVHIGRAKTAQSIDNPIAGVQTITVRIIRQCTRVWTKRLVKRNVCGHQKTVSGNTNRDMNRRMELIDLVKFASA